MLLQWGSTAPRLGPPRTQAPPCSCTENPRPTTPPLAALRGCARCNPPPARLKAKFHDRPPTSLHRPPNPNLQPTRSIDRPCSPPRRSGNRDPQSITNLRATTARPTTRHDDADNK